MLNASRKMKINRKVSTSNKVLLSTFLILCMNFIYPYNNALSNSNSKKNEVDVNQLDKKSEKIKEKEINRINSDNNLHEIMSTQGSCTASCCSKSNSEKNMNDLKKKAKKKNKTKFGWFFKSK